MPSSGYPEYDRLIEAWEKRKAEEEAKKLETKNEE